MNRSRKWLPASLRWGFGKQWAVDPPHQEGLRHYAVGVGPAMPPTPSESTSSLTPKDSAAMAFSSPATPEPIPSRKAFASVILGVLALCFNLFTGVPAVILGLLALAEIRGSKGRLGGESMALGGIVTGSAFTLLNATIILSGYYGVSHVENIKAAEANLRTIGRALLKYDQEQMQFPPAAIPNAELAIAPEGRDAARPGLSWRVLLLPQLGEKALFDKFHLDEPWDSPHNSKLIPEMPAAYVLPGAAAPAGQTHWRVFVGPDAVFDPGVVVRLSEVPEAHATAVVVQSRDAVVWTKPDELPLREEGELAPLGGQFIGGFHILMADGSVRYARQNISANELRTLISRSGGKNLPSDLFAN